MVCMPVAEDEEPAVGVSLILERKPDAGNPHVQFDEPGRGNVVREKTKAPTTGESRRQQQFPFRKIERASPRLHKYTPYPLQRGVVKAKE